MAISDSTISFSAAPNSPIAAPAALTTPPVSASSEASAALTTGPMVASQTLTKSCQAWSSLIRTRTTLAKVWSTSARMASSGSQSSSLALSTQ